MMSKKPINVDAILMEMRETRDIVQCEIDLEQSDEQAIDEAIPSLIEALEEYVTT